MFSAAMLNQMMLAHPCYVVNIDVISIGNVVNGNNTSGSTVLWLL